MNKTKAIQLPLGKQFNRGGARAKAGRPKGDFERRKLWLSRTTLAQLDTICLREGATPDGVLSVALRELEVLLHGK